MLQNRSFQTNLYASFKSHNSRKHADCTAKDFKVWVVESGDANGEHELSEAQLILG